MKSTAAGLAALGRGPDSMLVHMSPREVAGLQQLAMAHGGSLTTNPHTGLPEAGVLDSMLPMIIGVGLNFLAPGVGTAVGSALGGLSGAAGTGLLVGGLHGLATGFKDPLKSVTAGLGAFSGAGLGGAAEASGLLGGAEAAGAGVPDVGLSGGNAPQIEAVKAAEAGARTSGITNAMSPQVYPSSVPTLAQPAAAVDPYAIDGAIGARSPDMATSAKPSFMQALGQQFDSAPAKAAAGIGAIGALGGFEQPQFGFAAPQQGASNYRAQAMNRRPYDPERNLFTDYGQLQPVYAAKGGEMHSVPQLEDGGFVLTKKAVDGLGKGDNERGQRAARAGLGAIPIKGPGTGTSDDIPTTIDGVRPAKVSNGEAYIPSKRVKQAGGAKKLYALMRKAEQDAKRRAA